VDKKKNIFLIKISCKFLLKPFTDKTSGGIPCNAVRAMVSGDQSIQKVKAGILPFPAILVQCGFGGFHGA